ncbi:hypothetical protein H8D99_00825 [bacterium]|nr:hypothetical protein [bacterium]
MEGTEIHIQANAKVNLSLSVQPSLENGMHPIVSRMARIAFFDDLEVSRLDSHALSRYAINWHESAPMQSEIDWSLTDDLAVRAHRLLEEHVGHPIPIQMRLDKRIPVGGGLGGGSADAAAMLKATAALFSLDANLPEIAKALGSDVPCLLNDGPCEVRGTGEIVEPTEFEMMHLCLIIPPYQCSTAKVYQAFDSMAIDHQNVNNNLLSAACIVEPRIAKDMQRIHAIIEQEVHLSGSGSTMFGICDNAEHATVLAKKIEELTNLVAIATHTC